MKKRATSIIISATLILVLGIIGIWAPQTSHAAPNLINYQGSLTDSGGTPVSDPSVSMTFRIYDDATSTSPVNKLWEEDQTVSVAGGIYNVLLGSGTTITGSFDPALFSTDNLWLEIEVNAEILTPRQQVTSVAFALRAEEANNAATAGDADTVDGSHAAALEESAEIDADIATHAGDASVHHAQTSNLLWSSITGKPAGFADDVDDDSGGTITGVTPGAGLNGGGTSGDVTLNVDVPLSLSGTGPVIKGTDSGSGNYGELGTSASGVYGNSSDGSGVYGSSTSGQGVYGGSSSGRGVYGSSSSGDGVYAYSTSGRGVYAYSSSSSGVVGSSSSGSGVYGGSTNGRGVVGTSTNGTGVYGRNSTSGNYGYLGTSGEGVYGLSISTNGTGVYGKNSGTGNYGSLGTSTYGVLGSTPSGTGVRGLSSSGKGVAGFNSTSGNYGYLGTDNEGVYGKSTSGTGVHGRTTSLTGTTYGVYGRSDSSSGSAGVYGYTNSLTGTTYGVYGESRSSSGYGVWGSSTSNTGVYGGSTSGKGVYGTSSSGKGVWGSSTSNTGVYGRNSGTGNYGSLGSSNYGVVGYSFSGTGVYGTSSSGKGVVGTSFSGYAGYFSGNVNITGSLSKGSGTFVQPHAEDPESEIQYAFFEGPEHAVFLRGTATLIDGTAVIELPEHFRVVAAEEGVQVQLTPKSVDTYGLAVVEENSERIVVKEFNDGKGNFKFNYFITAVRAGFEAHEPVVANTHFKPEANETVAEFEQRYSRDDMTTKAIKAMLVSNGILTEDGKLNMAKVEELGWTLAEESTLPEDTDKEVGMR